MEITQLTIDKNRGWRGLAEVKTYDKVGNRVTDMIFSFSQQVWNDMLDGYMVVQTQEEYILLNFNHTDRLPKPTQQRSVLIKNFIADIKNYWVYPKTDWTDQALKLGHYSYISHFTQNKNNHTQSDWNCIGIRVVPMI